MMEGALPAGLRDVTGSLRVLLLCHFTPNSAGTIMDHIQAFPRFSANHYYVLSNLGDLPEWLDLSRFDALIVHYSLVASYDNFISPQARKQIRDFSGFKAAFVQDDYRWINDTVDALAFMKINALFPLVGPEIVDLVYSPERLPNVRRQTVLTGYVPDDLTHRPVPPLAVRPIDVGYRARKLPPWMGSHVLQKWQIADRFRADARKYSLKVDLSYRERDRIYGEAWVRFVTSCKAVLGTESGASVCDFTGEIQRRVEAHLARDPRADFETLRRLYFQEEDGRIMMNVISPRCFEAAALRTLMILYEGHYSGALKPWRHYVPLAKDHSNMDDVVSILRDPAAAQRIVDAAYQEVALNPAYTFRAMVNVVDQVMAEGFKESMRATKLAYSEAEFSWRTRDTELDVSQLLRMSAPSNIASQDALTGLLVERKDKTSVISEPAHLPPHTLVVSCPIRFRILGVHLHWATPDSAAAEGEVVLLYRGVRVGAASLRTAIPTYYSYIPLSPHLPKADAIQLVFFRYHSGSHMRLMDVRIDSSTLPLRERVRRFRRRLGEIVIYHLTDAWIALPISVRSKVRRLAKGAFEAVFGRR